MSDINMSLHISGINAEDTSEILDLFEYNISPAPAFEDGVLTVSFTRSTLDAETPEEWSARVQGELRARFVNIVLQPEIL